MKKSQDTATLLNVLLVAASSFAILIFVILMILIPVEYGNGYEERDTLWIPISYFVMFLWAGGAPILYVFGMCHEKRRSMKILMTVFVVLPALAFSVLMTICDRVFSTGVF